jgi:hypothetical protein
MIQVRRRMGSMVTGRTGASGFLDSGSCELVSLVGAGMSAYVSSEAILKIRIR